MAKRNKLQRTGSFPPVIERFACVFRSLFLILSGNTATAFLVLARTLIIARLIPIEDFGIAATFAMTMTVLQMTSNIGMAQQIIQARDGNDPHLQAALQGFKVLRGLALGLILFLIARPVAQFMGVPEVTWGFQLLALAPVISGFSHFDPARHKRTMNYLPSVLTGAMPAFVALLAVWPLVEVFGDWRVMLYTILLRRVVGVATGHLLAERPYRLAFDRAVIARSVRFGWPLLINGALLYLVFQGDKLIVGRELGMAALAILAMGFTLNQAPTQIAAASARSFFLPQLSASHDDPARFAILAAATMQVSLIIGAALVVVIALIGEPLVIGLLGEKYMALPPLMNELAILSAIRVFKSGGAVIALARAQTANAMIGNLFRVASLPLSWYVLTQGAGLQEVIWIAIAGEISGFTASLLLVRFRVKLSLRPLLWPIGFTVLILAIASPSLTSAVAVPSWGVPLALISLLALLIFSVRALRLYIARRVLTKFDA